jgi:hypothetical protein
VSLAFSEGVETSEFERAVLSDLDAGLSGRGLSACLDDATAARPPAAIVNVSGNPSSDESLDVEVRDAVTKKRVSREIDLQRVPSDGRPFAVALAIDELVWATWAELALNPEEARESDAPSEVVDAVEEELPTKSRGAWLGARGGLEIFPGQVTQIGGDAQFLAAISQRVALELALALRQGLSTEAGNGTVTSRSIGVAAGLRIELVSGDATALDLAFGARTSLFQFQGRAEAGAGARDFTAIAVDAQGTLHLRRRLFGPTSVDLGAGMGWPLRSVHAADDGADVSSVEGPEVLGRLGFWVEL